ncbi:hypothetical protein THMIRHAM_02250 [Thiomicrorhabdus immobilis]|uniref:DUF3616 domain-containing protein n=1 Tax=Thiomicrorhabdus immobilis TaxID=2791037 RepID=A0ABM7MAV8_9GAMM|nr:DUF3616 domain-containing protein [Thiomicrorhabdus immobilis]BCN92440.1 hypothetical protein THMIRHAM_02250 [Thiomicrorhabdus immobilis]
MRIIILFTVLLSNLIVSPLTWAKPIAQILNDQAWSFSEPLKIDPLNISGVVITDNFMALATDEGNQIQIFKADNKKSWKSINVIQLSDDSEEMDIEALAWQAPYLYALGSHSAKRKKLKNSLNQKDNIARLQTIYAEPARQKLVRLELDSAARVIQQQSLSIQQELTRHPLLKPFIGLPSKENGIDIEGLAIDGQGRLLLGFRGPVFRGNIVPILRLKLAKNRFAIKKSKLLYITTAGNGVRGLSEVPLSKPEQFLVLSGAVGDQPLPYQVSLWNAENAITANDTPSDNLIHLCDLPPSSGKPEGIQFIKKQAHSIDFLIVQDGLKNGQAHLYRCPIKTHG